MEKAAERFLEVAPVDETAATDTPSSSPNGLSCGHSRHFTCFSSPPLQIANPPGNPQNRFWRAQEDHQKMRNIPGMQTAAFSSNYGLCELLLVTNTCNKYYCTFGLAS